MLMEELEENTDTDMKRECLDTRSGLWTMLGSWVKMDLFSHAHGFHSNFISRHPSFTQPHCCGPSMALKEKKIPPNNIVVSIHLIILLEFGKVME